MSKTTSDPGTPIFGELNKELGELPDIEVHDFDSYGFDFSKDTSSGTAAKEPADQDKAVKSADSSPSEPASESTTTGGRRRRKES